MTESGGDRLVTVTTLDHAASDVDRWLRRTTASGVDHLVVFLDPNRSHHLAALESHPRVTVVPVDAGNGDTPPTTAREVHLLHANLAATALSAVPAVRWLAPLDVEEELQFDRVALMALEDDAVGFEPLEAVAVLDPPAELPVWFKRWPAPSELHALAALGAIREPDLASYLRHPHRGAPVVRPTAEVRLSADAARLRSGAELATATHPGMRRLRHGSWSFASFLASAGRGDDQETETRSLVELETRAAVDLLATDPRGAGRRLLADVFARLVVDDLRRLRMFGLAVEVRRDPAAAHPLAAADVRTLEHALGELLALDPARFAPADAPTATEIGS